MTQEIKVKLKRSCYRDQTGWWRCGLVSPPKARYWYYLKYSDRDKTFRFFLISLTCGQNSEGHKAFSREQNNQTRAPLVWRRFWEAPGSAPGRRSVKARDWNHGKLRGSARRRFSSLHDYATKLERRWSGSKERPTGLWAEAPRREETLDLDGSQCATDIQTFLWAAACCGRGDARVSLQNCKKKKKESAESFISPPEGFSFLQCRLMQRCPPASS